MRIFSSGQFFVYSIGLILILLVFLTDISKNMSLVTRVARPIRFCKKIPDYSFYNARHAALVVP